MSLKYFLPLLLLFVFSCEEETNSSAVSSKLFTSLSPSQTGVTFNNKLTFTEAYNPYTFKNFLNGGGVAIGDINNDGLADIYLTGNLVENNLYLNKGNFEFEDISKSAKISCPDVWSTGAAFVDINHDGYLDLYVCKSGKPDASNRENQFFINNGDLTFTDAAEVYGMNFKGLSIHAAFFDYDKDGDLDCYLLNNSIRSVGAYDIIEDQRLRPNPDGGNNLMKNMEVETGQIKFEDVSTSAGIYTSSIGFGLGVSIADLNEDGWDDIYVSNDFFEKDYLYINQKDGTFKEVIDLCTDELSTGSMGADIADLNNDALPEIFVTEMLPENLERYKSKTVFDSYDKSKLNERKGYHRQFGRNTLQYNQGLQNNKPHFIELGRYHGVEATDWSWGALLADFDNNGHKDIFVANGIYKDLLDQDHINFYSPDQISKMVKAKKEDVILTIMNKLPSTPLPNYLFSQSPTTNNKKEQFTKIELPQTPGYSNGSAYADLNNDGNLDLVINNINAPASIYKNKGNNNKYIKIKLKGDELNPFAIGTKVIVHEKDQKFLLENHPMRGYQSCITSELLFGMNDIQYIDSLVIHWPNLKRSLYKDLKTDSTYTLSIKDAALKSNGPTQVSNNTLLSKKEGIINFRHEELPYPDFDRNRMIPFKITNAGPKVSVLDLDGDKDEDLMLAGYTRNGISYFENIGSSFKEKNIPGDEKRIYADKVVVDDFNNDGTQDALLLRGGFQHIQKSKDTEDLLLLNTKTGFKLKSLGVQMSSSNAALVDLNKDGIKALIVTPFGEMGAYGKPASGKIYNFKSGNYVVDEKLSQGLISMGMSNASGFDLDPEGNLKNLIVAQPFGPIKTFITSTDGTEMVRTIPPNLSKVSGMWQDMKLVDIDMDGDQDIIVCNIGENNRLKNISNGSLYIFVSDFDNNGREDIIYCMKENNKHYPIHLKDELLMQMPKLKKKSLKYEDYARISIEELFGDDIKPQKYEVNEWRSGVFINQEDRDYTFMPFPKEVQYSEMKTVCATDLNEDGYKDLILGGNQYEAKPEFGINAASHGIVLINDKKGNFEFLSSKESGFFEKGEIRDILAVDLKDGKYVLVFKNNAAASAYKIN